MRTRPDRRGQRPAGPHPPCGSANLVSADAELAGFVDRGAPCVRCAPIVGRVASDADLPAGGTPAPAGQRAQRLRKADDARVGYPYRYVTDATPAGIRATHAGLAP